MSALSDYPILALAIGLVRSLLPGGLLLIVTIMDSRFRKTWHWWLRLLSAILLPLLSVSWMLLLRFIVSAVGGDRFLEINWMVSSASMGLWLLFIAGYLGMVLACRQDGEIIELLAKQTESMSSSHP